MIAGFFQGTDITSTEMARACPVCGARESNHVEAVRFAPIDGLTPHEGYDVVNCLTCGMVYADCSVNEADWRTYYERSQKYRTTSLCDGLRAKHLAERILADDPRPRQVLDVGAGSGALSLFLPHVTGCEFDIPEGVYGVAVLSGVLEHVPDPGALLSRLRPVMGIGASLYIELPDAEGFRTTETSAPFQEFSVEHINYFTIQTITHLLARHGWRVTEYEHNATGQTTTLEVANLSVVADMLPPDYGPLVVRDYCMGSGDAWRTVRNEARRAVHGGAVLWGCGTFGQRLILELPSRDIHAVTDSNTAYHGRTIRGHPILPPAEAVALRLPIVIASTGYTDEIEAEARALGATDVRRLGVGVPA